MGANSEFSRWLRFSKEDVNAEAIDLGWICRPLFGLRLQDVNFAGAGRLWKHFRHGDRRAGRRGDGREGHGDFDSQRYDNRNHYKREWKLRSYSLDPGRVQDSD